MIVNRKEATLMKLFVGLAVSSFDIKVCCLNSDGDQIKSFAVNNDLLVVMKLRDDILNTSKGQSIGVLRIGLESTSVYSFHPSMFLDNDESLQALGANSVRRHVPEYKDYYAKKYQEVPKH